MKHVVKAKNSMRCDECKHWREKVGEWEAEQAGLHVCLAVRTRWDIADEASADLAQDTDAQTIMHMRRDALRAARAYVQDGSQYTASLWTMPDFFCALFKAKGAEDA